MAKIDKSQYSKAEWQKIREQRRESKPPPVLQTDSEKTVLCVKHGNKYKSEYANRLFNMVSRNTTQKFRFVCLTDDTQGLDKKIKDIKLPKDLSGWWCKPYMFSSELPVDGTILYLDLDLVISGSLDKLWDFSPNNWCIIRDFVRKMRPKWQKYNSSVIKFRKNELNFIWENFKKNRNTIQKKYLGDQDYLYAISETLPPTFWPDNWIMSYKWEIRHSKEINLKQPRGNRCFKKIEDVKPPKECSIAVFHGDPNPELVEDPWVKQNWR